MFGGQVAMPKPSATCCQKLIPELAGEEARGAVFTGWLVVDPAGGPEAR
jgi:hypothetical protein